MTYGEMNSIFDHAQHLRRLGNDMQAKLYIIGCYCPHTEKNCTLRQHWATMRSIINRNNADYTSMTYGEAVRFCNTYKIACSVIAYLFGRYAWYNTLT